MNYTDLRLANDLNYMLAHLFNEEGVVFPRIEFNAGISSPAQWNPAKGVLEINPKSAFWKDLQSQMKKNKKKKITSTDSVFHVI